jgi:hypothetical protein
MTPEIRPAVAADLPRLMELYAAARAFMRRRGNTVQWVGGYPSAELVAAGIAAGEQRVLVTEECGTADAGGGGLDYGRNGGGLGYAVSGDARSTADVGGSERIAATFWFAPGPEPTYARIEGGPGWLDDAPYGVVHRLASDGSVGGVGERCLGWALARCGNLRVDTHESNAVMQRLLARMGFTRCGVVLMSDGTPRDAFQKNILTLRFAR